jgi:nickel superoxide dismutase
MNRAYTIVIALTCVIVACRASAPRAHCEIPCGIYHDELRIELIREHIETIEKSMSQIVELSKSTPLNYNQLVRWIDNKEEHADQIQEIVSQYFMTQRVKTAEAKDAAAYGKSVEQITLLHAMLVEAMKAKQTTDPAAVEKLKVLTGQFYEAYFGKAEKEHIEKQHR